MNGDGACSDAGFWPPKRLGPDVTWGFPNKVEAGCEVDMVAVESVGLVDPKGLPPGATLNGFEGAD